MSEVFTSTPHGRLNLEYQHVNGCAFDGEVESSFNVQTSDIDRALGRWVGTESRSRRAVQTSALQPRVSHAVHADGSTPQG